MSNSSKRIALCTLAVGEKYVNYTLSLALDMEGSGNALVVVSDTPERFSDNVTVIPFQNDTTHICQQKRIAVKEALKYYDIAFFIDADYKTNHKSLYYKEVYGNTETFPRIDINLPKGLYSCIPKTKTKKMVNIRPSIEPVLNGLCGLLSVNIEDVVDVSCSSWFFSLDDEKTYLQFFTIWDQIAFWLKDNNYIIPDGIAMSFAAAKSGIDVYGSENQLPWDPIKGALAHDLIGDWHKNNFAGWT